MGGIKKEKRKTLCDSLKLIFQARRGFDPGSNKKDVRKTLCDSLIQKYSEIRLVGDSNPGLQIQSLLC